MNARIRKEYAAFSGQQLLELAYELGFNFEKFSHSCSQSTVAALHDLLDIDDIVLKVATSCSGGQAGRVAGTCGALIGGTIALDYFFGRTADNISSTESRKANLEPLSGASRVAGLLYERYIVEYGTILCPHIQTQLYGRHFYLRSEEEKARFEQAGGHGDSKKSCCHVVGNASRWVMEILIDEGAVAP